MAGFSFIDNNFEYVRSFMARNYDELANKITQEKIEYDFSVVEEDKLLAYKITTNKALTDLYGFDCYVVKFYFANFSALHMDFQEKLVKQLVLNLKAKMETTGGYYNLRIPTHMIDLVKVINSELEHTILCGGTVEEYISGKNVGENNKSGLKIFQANQDYLDEHRETLLDMTYESFKSYQGQYHISYVTESKAGEIYKNWIAESLNGNGNEKTFVAEYQDEPVGFVTTAEDEYAVEGILSAVSGAKRQLGAYKAMISAIINYANNNNKAFITSTQFDNFIVQGTWNSLGLKPFYSIYNIHIDYRK